MDEWISSLLINSSTHPPIIHSINYSLYEKETKYSFCRMMNRVTCYANFLIAAVCLHTARYYGSCGGTFSIWNKGTDGGEVCLRSSFCKICSYQIWKAEKVLDSKKHFRKPS